MLVWPLRRLLHQRSAEHLRQNRRQVVVFAFDHIAHTINLDGVYEREDLEVFFGWLSTLNVDTHSACAIDVGANIGNHSLYFSDHFLRVFSFEPNPRTFDVLRLNSKLVDNIECYSCGLSDGQRTAALSIQNSNVGASSITSDSGAEGVQEIELRTLDSLDLTEKIKLLKIDVEGHEYQVISGARSLIQRNQPIVLFEQHRRDFEGGNSRVVQILKELGYGTFGTVVRWPQIRRGTLKRMLFLPVVRFLLGQRIDIRLGSDLVPGDYFFVIAVPGWVLELEAKAAA